MHTDTNEYFKWRFHITERSELIACPDCLSGSTLINNKKERIIKNTYENKNYSTYYNL